MGASKLILVSDHPTIIQSVKSFANRYGLNIKVHSISEWQCQNNGRMAVNQQGPSEEARVLAFRPKGERQGIYSIDELESMAIKNALFQLNGNLTKTSKALGIGRSTLYRKLKYYNINVSEVRRQCRKVA